MKRAYALTAILLLTLCLRAQEVIRVPDGTAVHIQLLEELSSQKLHNGDVVHFEVAEPVVVGEVVVISKGATARAVILDSRAAGHWGRNGRIAWVMKSVSALNGTELPLRFVKEIPQGGLGAKKPTKKVLAAEAAALSPFILYYSPALVAMVPFAAASKGKPEVIPAGERYLVFVNGEAELPLPTSNP